MPEEDIVILPHETEPYREPKSLIDALSDIQQYMIMESQGQVNFPEHFLTPRRTISYLQIGFTYGFGESFLQFLIAPLLYGVIFNYLPIFGNPFPSLWDKVYIFILTKYLPAGLLALMLILLAKARGPLSGGCTTALATGYALSLIVRIFAALYGYRLIYSLWPLICQKLHSFGTSLLSLNLSPTNLAGSLIIILTTKLSPLKKLFLISSNYETLFSLGMLIILCLTWLFFKFVQKKQLNPYYQKFQR